MTKLPPGATIDLSDRYAEKSAAWPKFVVVAFFVWWIYAFLNDSDGRLYRWTDGAYGKVPVEVQKLLDEEKAKDRTAAKEKAAQDKQLQQSNTNSAAAGK